MKYQIEDVNLAPMFLIAKFLPKKAVKKITNKPRSFKVHKAKVKSTEMPNGQMTTAVDNFPFLPAAEVIRVGDVGPNAVNSPKIGDVIYVTMAMAQPTNAFYLDPESALSNENVGGDFFGTNMLILRVHDVRAWISKDNVENYSEALAVAAEQDLEDSLKDVITNE